MSTRALDSAETLIAAFKERYRLSSDEEVAKAICVGKSTIASWRRRGKIPRKALTFINDEYGINPETASLILARSAQERSDLQATAFYTWIVLLSREHSKRPPEQLGGVLANFEVELVDAFRTIAGRPEYEGAVGARALLDDLIHRRLHPDKILDRFIESLTDGSMDVPPDR